MEFDFVKAKANKGENGKKRNFLAAYGAVMVGSVQWATALLSLFRQLHWAICLLCGMMLSCVLKEYARGWVPITLYLLPALIWSVSCLL